MFSCSVLFICRDVFVPSRLSGIHISEKWVPAKRGGVNNRENNHAENVKIITYIRAQEIAIIKTSGSHINIHFPAIGTILKFSGNIYLK